MKTLTLLLLFVGFVMCQAANPAPPAPAPTAPLVPKLELPAVWYYYMDDSRKTRMGELTFETGGRFKLERWDGKHTDTGKWKKSTKGVTMTFTSISELPGVIDVDGDKAVWRRAIGDRFLAVKPVTE